MMKVQILKECINGELTGKISYWVFCPGCNEAHRFDDRWGFDGNLEEPTFSPSLKVTYRHPRGHSNDNPAPLGYDGPYDEDVCHSFLRSGMWEFLGDSTHALAGKTVPMVDLPDWITES